MKNVECKCECIYNSAFVLIEIGAFPDEISHAYDDFVPNGKANLAREFFCATICPKRQACAGKIQKTEEIPFPEDELKKVITIHLAEKEKWKEHEVLRVIDDIMIVINRNIHDHMAYHNIPYGDYGRAVWSFMDKFCYLEEGLRRVIGFTKTQVA